MYVDGSDILDFTFTEAFDLDSKSVEKICRQPAWTIEQASFAANNKWPKGSSSDHDVNTPLSTRILIFDIRAHLIQATEAGQLKCSFGSDQKTRYVIPRELTAWLHQFRYYKATLLYRHFNLQPPSVTIRDHYDETFVPIHIKNEILEEYRKSPRGKQRWIIRALQMYCAKVFMSEWIEQKECRCRHNLLAAFTYHSLYWDNHTLSDQDQKNTNIFKALKATALKIVPPERRFGSIDENGIMRFDKNACLCHLPEHREITLPSGK